MFFERVLCLKKGRFTFHHLLEDPQYIARPVVAQNLNL